MDSQPNNKSNLNKVSKPQIYRVYTKMNHGCAAVISGGYTDGCLSLFLSLGQQKALGMGKNS